MNNLFDLKDDDDNIYNNNNNNNNVNFNKNNIKKNIEETLKVILLVDDESGKYILMEREHYVELCVKKIEFEKLNIYIKFYIWDTAIKCGFLPKSYFTKVSIIIFVYDITSKKVMKKLKIIGINNIK